MPRPLLILASTSPYRRALLERLRLPFEVVAPHVDETRHAGESGTATALRLAEAKARAVARMRPDACIIGSDQVAVLDGEHIGKPGSHDAALRQLMMMSGKTVLFHTAVCLVAPAADGGVQTRSVPTSVRFRRYTSDQAEHYLVAERPYDCAGSAKIEAFGIALTDAVHSDDPTALIGLPLIATVSMLAAAGIDVFAE